jgi:hypothetical protein
LRPEEDSTEGDRRKKKKLFAGRKRNAQRKPGELQLHMKRAFGAMLEALRFNSLTSMPEAPEALRFNSLTARLLMSPPEPLLPLHNYSQ